MCVHGSARQLSSPRAMVACGRMHDAYARMCVWMCVCVCAWLTGTDAAGG